jgi:hypothetical protein
VRRHGQHRRTRGPVPNQSSPADVTKINQKH